ncbi:MAG: hypothetical protein Q9173_004910 [Seirophora scorigena]
MRKHTLPLLATTSVEDESVTLGKKDYQQDTNIIRPTSPLHFACSLSRPAVVLPNLRPLSAQPPIAVYHSRSSIHTWLDQTPLPTETSIATQTSHEQDFRANRLKRRRSVSPDLEKAAPAFAAPLTRKALEQHLTLTMSSDQSTLVDQIFTPTKNAASSASLYQTPTSTSNPSKPSLPPSEIRYHMEAHRLFIDKGLLLNPDMAGFRDLIMTVAETERPSGRKPESEKRWQNRMKKIHVHNEATMLDLILPLLVKVGRQVPVQGPATQVEAFMDEQAYASIWEDFEDSGLDWTLDREFARNFLPNTYHAVGYHDQIAKALAKERGIKNPKPDRAYGLAIDNIPPPEDEAGQLRDETRALLNAIPGLQHVFFLIEGVQSAGDLRKAMNQACRGGTVAVRTQRLLLEAIGYDTMRQGPDHQTYVYTATIDDNIMSFWVNFAVIKKAMPSGQHIVNYHMEHVYTYSFRSPDAELYLRRVCHNILDWGVRSRRPMLEERCSNMYEVERLRIDQDAAELQAEAATAAAAAAALAAQEQASGTKKRKLAPGSVSQKSR